MEGLIVAVPVVVGILAFVVFQRRAVAGGFDAAEATAASVAASGPVQDAGPLSWEEVLGALRLDPSEALPPVEHQRFMSAVGRATARSDAMFRPLGLAVEETARLRHVPNTHIREVEGKTRVEGRRHGREVKVTVGQKASRVELRGEPVAAFIVRGSGGELAVDPDAPDGVRRAVEALAPAKRWSGVRVKGGDDGVVVTRDGNKPEQSWFHDLWLAEHLAGAAA